MLQGEDRGVFVYSLYIVNVKMLIKASTVGFQTNRECLITPKF